MISKEAQVQKWLKEYESMKINIEYLKESRLDIIEAGMGVNTTKDSICKTNKPSSIVENATLQIGELNITHRIKSLTNTINALDRALATLSEVEKVVIINRCMKGQYYYQFVYKICYSERTAHTIKRNAIKKMVNFIFGSAEVVNIHSKAM